MFDNINYQSNREEFIINGFSPDYIEDFSHKILFSIENTSKKISFSYNIGISHHLWQLHWKIDPNNEGQINKVKEIYLEKAKRLIDNGIEEYTDVTLMPANTPNDLDEAVNSLKK